jgi:type IV secretory pathway VirD2 relaxase
MFGEKCRTKRCSKMLNSYHPEIYDIESYKKRVFVYTSKKYDFFTDRKESICSREIYGY